ncbi:MAG: prepilin-type N-terminal cleavage/methylation domain-containing protein [Patescibacteria group bacterium]
MLARLNLKYQDKKSAGFTLLELLVVVAVIGLLSTIVLFAVENIRAKSRDSRRVADIKTLQEAFSLYYNNNYLYPDSGGDNIEITKSDSISAALINDGVIMAMPIDPLNRERDGVTYKYYYQSLDSRKDYQITYYLETNSIQGKSKGENIAGP